MGKKFLKIISLIVTPILILACLTSLMLKNIPGHMYVKDEAMAACTLEENSPLNSVKVIDEKLKVSFLGLIPIKSVDITKVDDIEVIPGGNCIGVKLSSKGVLVVGYTDITLDSGETVKGASQKSGIEIGDIILKINEKDIETSKELIKALHSLKSNKVSLKILRKEKEMDIPVSLMEVKNEYKLGLWIRDTTSGVGTMTFYDEKTKTFGALGHPVTDSDTNESFKISEGSLVNSSIISVKRGEKGSPGELKGVFIDDKNSIGQINKNTECGIFGSYKKCDSFFKKKPIKIALRDEIKLGEASILTTVDESGPKEFKIEIEKLFIQNEKGPKSMVIRITDEELLRETGGIVQGMSGSPIIQDGKIIGAVTHVLINKPEVGYGIYIDWMLEEAGILK